MDSCEIVIHGTDNLLFPSQRNRGGDGVPGGGEAAVVSSLDPIQTNNGEIIRVNTYLSTGRDQRLSIVKPLFHNWLPSWGMALSRHFAAYPVTKTEQTVVGQRASGHPCGKLFSMNEPYLVFIGKQAAYRPKAAVLLAKTCYLSQGPCLMWPKSTLASWKSYSATTSARFTCARMPAKPLLTRPAIIEEPVNWFHNPDWWMVILTTLLFVVGAVTLRVFYRQFKEMQKQTGILVPKPSRLRLIPSNPPRKSNGNS